MPYQKVLETDMDRVIRLSNFPTIIIVQDISRALTNRQARYRAGVAVTVLENGHVRGGYCQAQPISSPSWLRLAFFPAFPHPPTQPATQPATRESLA